MSKAAEFFKGLAISILGTILWVIASAVTALEVFGGVFTLGRLLMVIGFFLIFFGPILFWIILPIKRKWLEGEKKRKKLGYGLMIPPIIFLLIIAVVGYSLVMGESELVESRTLNKSVISDEENVNLTVHWLKIYKSFKGHKPEEGKRFVIIHVSVENMGNKSEELGNPFSFELKTNAAIYEMELFPVPSMENELHSRNLSPNEKNEGNIGFEISEEENPIELIYDTFYGDPFEGEDVHITIDLREK
jgi:amino acid transporter